MAPVVLEAAETTNGAAKPIVSTKVMEKSIRPITAEEEYAKNPSLKKSDIQELQEWVKFQPQLPPDITEEQLILFYHSCYYDMEKTKNCINVYFSIRMGSSDYFVKRDVLTPALKQATETLEYGILPVRDPNGYQIIFHRLKLYDVSKYVFADGVKLLSMSIDSICHVEGTVPGFIFLFDMKGVKLAHLTKLSLSALRKFFVYVQEGLPVRLKAIHVLNTKPLIDKIMILVKPFMKKELLSMVHFHFANDMDKVYQILPQNCLPSDFGGELKSCEEFHQDYVQWMEKLRKFFEEDEEKYVLVETKKNNSIKSAPVDFQNLSID